MKYWGDSWDRPVDHSYGSRGPFQTEFLMSRFRMSPSGYQAGRLSSLAIEY